jgi:tRNA threonylcarbamoyladenosine biosynthesis protein TsaB
VELFIDTTNNKKIKVGLDGKVYTKTVKTKEAQKLLVFIDEILKRHKKSLAQIKSIRVNTGPGSFTGTRVGVSVANAIGWALGIFVNNKSLKDGKIVDITYK